MNIFQVFSETCEKYPDKACLKFKNGEAYEGVTYAELFRRVRELRSELIKARVRPGQRVAILLTNGVNWPVAFFAAVSIQAVAVPIDTQLSPKEMRSILLHSATKMLLTEDKFGVSLGSVFTWDTGIKLRFIDRLDVTVVPESVNEAAARLGAYETHKLAALFYTSGTTQEHKAVMLTHKNLLANFNSIEELNIIQGDDVLVSLLPLHHTYPFMITCLAPFLKGACVCYFSSMAYHELFSCIKENNVTIFVGVPQLFTLIERSVADRLKKYGLALRWPMNRLLDVCVGLSAVSGRNVCKVFLKGLHNVFGPTLRFMVSGGAKLDPQVARSFTRWGYKIIEGYGLTETSPVVAFNNADIGKFASVGRALPGVDISIVNSGSDGVGEIAVRGDNVMLGYYRAPSLTKKVFLKDWFLTGDAGFKDKAGYLHITGRQNELIALPSGKKVSPEAVEAEYLKSPFIKEVCVLYAKSGAEGGHLVAVVVPNEEELRAKRHFNIHFKLRWELDNVSQQMPPYQRITGFVLSKEALPRTRLGKILRYKIDEKYKAGGFAQDEKKYIGPEELSEFENMALRYFSKILKKTVNLDDHLELDLGLDSLGRIELLSSLQELVKVGIDDSLALEMFQARTIRDIITKAREAFPASAFTDFLKRDDMVFWPHILAQAPSPEDKAKLKLHFDIFDKFVSALEILLFKFKFMVLFSVKVKGKARIPQAGPFVITPNHVTYLDAFFVLCALPTRLILNTYFVGFGEIFNHPLLAWALRFHRLIPIDANLDLAKTLKLCKYVLGQGKILVYFPEGQRSADGTLKEFRKGIGILAKESGAKILPMYIDGAYKAWPRTRAFPLPGQVTVKIGECLDVDDLSHGAGEDPYTVIARNLRAKMVGLV
ncbi:MAG: hypothetical protein AUJ74_03845 [Candidatus Omnitrophica bacterium CG1_02_44_16]|nr:MAG: hypothetical protein AUJ74_03845 [Candidatus Omnitrophica bacterium CG1_02_44_16]PIY82207.1 MAG: hypothetical protein COY78_07875 [Candidatus Omnitrophica bacterium CG_4_10_14_0_8_um_filter_44_12]PIZ84974.1 MAG: hypothetical protein COX96_01000 [Candidatus Omnitrophica bacterium CG_4_10_14_0_2_um_filter_44_9]